MPAAPLAALAFLRAGAALMNGAARKSALQVFGSATVGYRDDDKTIAVLGLYPAGDHVEAWLVGDPDGARPHLLAIARHARLTLAVAREHQSAPIRAHVRWGHEPGRRLARLVGFASAADDAAPFERWEIS